MLILLYYIFFLFFFFFKQKTAYEISVRDWSSDVCSSDLERPPQVEAAAGDVDREAGQVPEGAVLEEHPRADHRERGGVAGGHVERLEVAVLEVVLHGGGRGARRLEGDPAHAVLAGEGAEEDRLLGRPQ